MTKKFNVTGTCFPDQHYMADVSDKLQKVKELIENGEYFIINRPRQFGKTTTMRTMGKFLRKTGEYIVFNTSFEGISDTTFQEEQLLSKSLIRHWAKSASLHTPDWATWLLEQMPSMNTLDDVSALITAMVNKTNKKVVMMIDEVDKSSNNQLFLSFLGMLRDKYLEREDLKTFHSVVLAGVHDIKTLKLKIRSGAERKFNSPWNIATDFEVDMHLQPAEIESMLKDYVSEKHVQMDTQHIAEQLFYYTSGYPYLVSKLCKIIDEKILPQKTEQSWAEQDVSNAIQMMLKEAENVNFDSLFINLEHNPDLYKLVSEIIFDNQEVDYDPKVPAVHLGILYGIFRTDDKGKIAIHNRIYRERIANYMVVKWQIESRKEKRYDLDAYNFRGQFVRADNSLDMTQVLVKFQSFMREHYSSKDRDFLERHGRLLFMAFVKPIINGAGFDFKEPQYSDEKRIDVLITFYQYRYVSELKLWYGAVAHEKGLIQLADYLDAVGLNEGYLVIFDHSKRKTWKTEWIDIQGKKVFAVWV